MRTSFPSGTRTAYLSGTVTPLARVTLRRLRLDFGATLYHDNDEAVITPTKYAGDDYYDAAGFSFLWGDSCVASVSPYAKLRIVSPAAWTTGGSASLFKSRATSGVDDWSLSSLTGSAGVTYGQGMRLGLYPVAGSEAYYVWYLNNAGDLYRETLTYTGWAWSNKSTGLDVSGYSGAAIHPVSASDAILVAYDDPYLWVRYCNWDGLDWDASTAMWVVHMSDQLIATDAHWSDAVVSPADSNKIVVAVNLSRWGSAQALLYDKVSGMWSQPREILPSAQQWGNLKVRVSGLTVINGRIWAVTVREPIGSRDIRYAHHVALASSPDGLNWTDEYFVTTSTLRGKLLYQSGEGYCYVAGNASVARAVATNRLGYDNPNLKHQVDEAFALSVGAAGSGSAPEVIVQAKIENLPGWTLPMGLQYTTGTLLEGFEDISDWTGTGGTFINDTTYYKSGTQSVRLTSDLGTARTREKVVSLGLSDVSRFAFWVYVHESMAVVQGFQLRFSSVTDWSKYLQLSPNLYHIAQGWNYIVALPSDFTIVGGESWDNTMIRIQIRVDGTAGNDLSISWDDLRIDPTFQPAVLVTFDDGIDDVYNDAHPYMQGRNVRGVAYIVSDHIGTAGRMTSTQLGTLDGCGWDIGNHSQTHSDFTLLTQEQIETEIANCNSALVGWGVGDARHHLAYPYGGRDADSDAAMAAQSMLTGRLALAAHQRAFWLPALSYLYRVPTIESLDSTITLAMAKGFVDDAVGDQRVIVFLLHNLAVSAGALTWAIADFQALIDYIIACGVPIITVSELYALLSGPVTIPEPT